MNTIKWSELKPEERDKLMHEKIMGGSIGMCAGIAYYTGRIGIDEWYCETCKKYHYDIGEDGKHDTPIPRYSRNMADTWLIIDHFEEALLQKPCQDRYLCWLYRDGNSYAATATTAQDAVCIAALRAHGVEVEL